MNPQQFVSTVREVQQLPYRWPAPPDAISTTTVQAGSCAGKHALLAQKLQSAGLSCAPLMIVGPLVPAIWQDLADEADGLLEVHECVTGVTPCSGPLIVDDTWHPVAVRAGLPGLSNNWDGYRGSLLAVDITNGAYAIPNNAFRDPNNASRDRRYSTEERKRRDRILTKLRIVQLDSHNTGNNPRRSCLFVGTHGQVGFAQASRQAGAEHAGAMTLNPVSYSLTLHGYSVGISHSRSKYKVTA